MLVLIVRIVFALSLAVLVAGIVGASAFAQTAAGKPLALLAGLNPPHQSAKSTAHTKPTAHLKTAAHKPVRKVARKFALRRRHAVAVAAAAPSPQPEPIPESAAPAGVQPVLDNPDTAQISPATGPAAAPASSGESAPLGQNADTQNSSAQNSGTLLMNGQSVEIASPDYLNDIDRGAARRDQAQDQAPRAASTPGAGTDAAPVNTQVAAVAVQADPAPIGSASWIAQMLAALGGAMAAGALAWFLIGSGPVRSYG